jgi:glycosyltransferase involved in cell wall biosynthesis
MLDKALFVKSSLIPNYLSYIPSSTFRTPNEVINFLFLGRIDKKKGINELLEAFLQITGDNTLDMDIKLTIAGEGPQSDVIRNKINESGLNNKINIIGYVEGAAKEHAFKNADYLILPSFEEAFPYSLLEAISFSVPVIATKVGAIPHVVKNGVNGYLIDKPTVPEVLKTLNLTIKNHNNYQFLAESAFKTSKLYSPEAMIQKFTYLWS